MSIKLVVGSKILNIASVYAPQTRLAKDIERLFWEHLDEVIQNISQSKKLVIGGDSNGHIGRERNGYDSAHKGFKYGERNDGGESILDFVVACEFAIVNSYFKKKEKHLLTFKSCRTKMQIDYFLMRETSSRWCKIVE